MRTDVDYALWLRDLEHGQPATDRIDLGELLEAVDYGRRDDYDCDQIVYVHPRWEWIPGHRHRLTLSMWRDTISVEFLNETLAFVRVNLEREGYL